MSWSWRASVPIERQNRLKLNVKSTVIDWQKQELEITDTEGLKHALPLRQEITVTMVGYPEREQKNMQARDLGQYMSRGYLIEEISFEETLAETEPEEADQQSAKQPLDIDLQHIARLWPAAMAMATKMRRDEEVELEHTLAALARDFLVKRGAISEEQREQVAMEVHYTGEGLPVYTVAYVRPGAQETPEHPRLILCALRKDGWHLRAMPGEPF